MTWLAEHWIHMDDIEMEMMTCIAGNVSVAAAAAVFVNIALRWSLLACLGSSSSDHLASIGWEFELTFGCDHNNNWSVRHTMQETR
jgi:hypothetical protein